MRFGQTRQQRYQKCLSMTQAGFSKFAFLPKKLEDGTYVWLEKYWILVKSEPFNFINRWLWWPSLRAYVKYDTIAMDDAVAMKLKTGKL